MHVPSTAASKTIVSGRSVASMVGSRDTASESKMVSGGTVAFAVSVVDSIIGEGFSEDPKEGIIVSLMAAGNSATTQ